MGLIRVAIMKEDGFTVVVCIAVVFLMLLWLRWLLLLLLWVMLPIMIINLLILHCTLVSTMTQIIQQQITITEYKRVEWSLLFSNCL